MQDLINRITQNLGIDASVAEKAVGIILQTLQKEAPAETVAPLINGLPGADSLISKVQTSEESSGGGFLSSALGSLTGNSAGVMESVTKLQNEGLNMNQIHGLAKETLQFAKEKVGEDIVKKVTDSMPALSQFI